MASTASAPSSVPSKRVSNANGEEKSFKQRRFYHHDHKISSRQLHEGGGRPAAVDSDSVQEQLRRAAMLVLTAVGFDSAEPEALESLANLINEYMAHFLSSVRRSMLAARRTQPLPHDFTVALSDNQLPLSSLLAHLNPPVSGPAVQPTLTVEDGGGDDSVQQAQLIDHLLNLNVQSQSYIPARFPALPSRHTFKADAVFRSATLDAKQIREQATVEGRLGEEALRRLMSKKASDDDTLLAGSHSDRRLVHRQQARSLWRDTYEHALQVAKGVDLDAMMVDRPRASGDANGKQLHVSPAINADSVYWRKPVTRRVTENGASEG